MNAMKLTHSAPSLKYQAHSDSSGPAWRHPDHVVLEICVEDVEGVRIAAREGADRVELGDNLTASGTTSSIGTIEAAIFAAAEQVEERRALAGPHWTRSSAAAPFGLRVVIGALTPDGAGDRGLVRLLMGMAEGAPVTFHRAFDEARDPVEIYGDLGGLGLDYVLTSGGAATAAQGAQVIAGLAGAEGPTVIAAGGIRPDSISALVALVRRAVEITRSLTLPTGAEEG